MYITGIMLLVLLWLDRFIKEKYPLFLLFRISDYYVLPPLCYTRILYSSIAFMRHFPGRRSGKNYIGILFFRPFGLHSLSGFTKKSEHGNWLIDTYFKPV